MKSGVKFGVLGGVLTAVLNLGACGSDDNKPGANPNEVPGSAGQGGEENAPSSGGEGSTADAGGAGGVEATDPTSGGSGGTSGSGNSSGSGGSSGSGFGSGGSMAGETCTPASTKELTFAGNCSTATYCTEHYFDGTLAVETLEESCTKRSGTWSASPCETEGWVKRCTEVIANKVYVHYMTETAFCLLGCQEEL